MQTIIYKTIAMIRSKTRSILLFLLSLGIMLQNLAGQADESLLLTFTKHKGPVYSVAVHPDGSTIATGAEDMLIHLWDAWTGKIRKTLEGHGKPVKYMSFSKDGRYLLSTAGTEIRVWDLVNGSSQKYAKHVTHVYNLDFNRDASRFLSTSLKNKFNEWDREEAGVVKTYEKHTRTCLVAAYSPDNTKIASGSLDRTIKIWDAGSGEVIHDISAHGGNIFSIDFSPDGKLLASASMDENIKIWNVETGRIHKLLGGHEYAVVFVRFSPDGHYLVSASYDKTAKLWEIATGNCIYTFIDHKDALYAAEFLSDSKLVTCSNDGTAMIYEITPRFFAEFYFFDELRQEMRESGLFEERRKGEKKEEYQLRQQKAAKLRKELHEKYYRKHLNGINQ